VHAVIYAVFILTYVLIASRRLFLLPIGRPAGALLGAVLLVLCGALSPHESFQAIDHDTIVLLFATMGITAYLQMAGFFEWLSRVTVSRCTTPMALLMTVSLLSGVLSAVMVNDTVCLFLTPIVVSVCTKAELPMGPYLIALATSANIGSSATLVGNPQNMLIGSRSGLGFGEFLMFAGPCAAVGLVVNMLLLAGYYRRRLPSRMPPIPFNTLRANRSRLAVCVLVTAGVVIGFFSGFHLGYTALTGLVVLILADRREPREVFSRIDWPLLLFFCSLFIVVAGLAKTGIIERSWNSSAPYMDWTHLTGMTLFTALMTIGSNLISNVPMVLMTAPHLSSLAHAKLGWVLLAFTTTTAGNFTLLGSVANIIVAETARDHYPLGFFEYLRFGLVSTVLVLTAGVAVIRWTML